MDTFIIVGVMSIMTLGTISCLLMMCTQYNSIQELRKEIQLLNDIIYSNEGKQVLHLKFGRRKADRGSRQT